MRRRLSLILTLAARLLATGSPWDLVQTFAWGRLFLENTRTMSLLAAVQRTFGPEGRCAICNAVSHAREQQDADAPSAPGGKTLAKIVLACGPAARVFLSPAPMCAGLAPTLSTPLSADRSAPPSPPPRALA